MNRRAKKYLLIAAAGLLALLAVGALAAHLAAQQVQARIVELLGPSGQAARIEVGLSQVVLHDVAIGGPQGWPAEQTLRARRIVCTPDWRSLVSRRLLIHSLTVEDYYLSVRRSSQGVELLPMLSGRAREKRAQSSAEGQPPQKWETEVGRIVLRDGQLDYYDAVAAKPAHHIAIDQLQAKIGPLYFPKRNEHTSLDVSGRMLGKARNGTFTLQGWLAAASRDADMRTRLAGVDAPVLAPYLYKGSPAMLAGGAVNLDMHTRIAQHRLNAQGHLELSHLKFGGGDSLASLPRKAVVAALEDRDGRVAFDFTLTGNLEDPKFSLEDSLSMRVVGGLGKAVGVSAKGIAESVGGAVQGLGEALSNLVEQH
ncbi:DUF748 domain-containing protein [Bordetella petrii]|uniref:DUF748 domain-containing protein n=1 Tax=Bordetella petrii TaxID=94624 RepID=UPI001E4DE361|nr:DUF748 domain-containing protein [Bordetella petrii]MCD0502082.1 DUF748 domain-containing protein [Bordetella petrii]